MPLTGAFASVHWGESAKEGVKGGTCLLDLDIVLGVYGPGA